MNEEIKRILKLVEDGKITSDQAADLISAIKEKGTEGEQARSSDRHFKVNITSAKGKNINVKLPLKFVKGILKATGKIPVHINGDHKLDTKMIEDAIENDVSGKVMEMTSDSGDYIEVVIE